MSGDKKNIIIYNTVDGKASVSLYDRDGMVWMDQSQIAVFFATSVPNISMHISNILKEGELDPNSGAVGDIPRILRFILQPSLSESYMCCPFCYRSLDFPTAALGGADTTETPLFL